MACCRGDRLSPALRLIAYSGIRRGECLGLHWQQVDFTRQEIIIVRSLVRSAELGLILEPPKSKASRRVIDLDDGTMQILREHKVQQMEQRLILGRTYEDCWQPAKVGHFETREIRCWMRVW